MPYAAQATAWQKSKCIMLGFDIDAFIKLLSHKKQVSY